MFKKLMRRIAIPAWKLWSFLEGNSWRIGVFAAIFDEKGRIILVKRKLDGLWSLPGGGIGRKDKAFFRGTDERKSGLLFAALHRELLEEMGVRPIQICPSPMGVFLSSELSDCAFVFLVKVEQEALESLAPGWEISEILPFYEEDIDMSKVLGYRMKDMIQWAFDQVAPG